MTRASPSAARSGIFLLGGDLPVHRLGFGAMRVTGPGIWGEPVNRDEAVATLRRTTDLGVTLIDTAESYGPHVSETLIAEALHPYPAGLVIASGGCGWIASTSINFTGSIPQYPRTSSSASFRRREATA